MKKLNTLIIVWALLMVSSAAMVSCCDCAPGERIEMNPVRVRHLRLTFGDSNYRDFTEYTYDMSDRELIMYRNADGAVTLFPILKNSGTMNLPGTTEDQGSILEQESYFEY